jgi:hypothetical protein
MKVVAAMLIHNAISHDRLDMAKENAWALSAEADELIVWDNGSTDGTADWVASIGGTCDVPADGVTTGGRGMNNAATAAAKRGDVVVLTADDMFWRPGWREIVETFWTHADPRIALFCGLLEPEYPWSVPEGGVNVGGVGGLIRPTVPGSGWTFRSKDWLEFIGPVPETQGKDDVPTCRRLVDWGRLLVAADLAEHRGEDRSLWGNQSYKYARPLDTRGYPVTSTATGSMVTPPPADDATDEGSL